MDGSMNRNESLLEIWMNGYFGTLRMPLWLRGKEILMSLNLDLCSFFCFYPLLHTIFQARCVCICADGYISYAYVLVRKVSSCNL